MDRHVEVLEQRIQPLPAGRRGREERLERVVVDHHQEEEEHLHDGQDRDDPGDEQAMPLAIEYTATLPNAASSVTQNMIEPSSPPQYDASL